MSRDTETDPEPDSSAELEVGQHAVSELSLWHSLRAYPAFRTLFLTTLATNSGFWMWIIASGWLALLLTDSPFFVGLVGFVGGIPTLLFGLFVGVLIDRFSRRSILMFAQTVVGLVAVVVALLLFLDLLQPWHLLLAAFLNGTSMSLIFPTRNAMVANVVPARHLANAVALNSAGQNATRVVGPALAGPFIVLLGTDGTFAVCALLQLIALFVSSRLPLMSAAEGPDRPGVLHSLGVGISTVWRSDYLLGMIILSAIPTLFLMPYINLMPVFTRDVLGLGSTGLGVLMAVNGIGAVVGSLYVAGARNLTANPHVLVLSGAGFSLILALFAISSPPMLAALFIFAAGGVSAIFMAVSNTLIQLFVDDAVRGRVMGIYVLTWGLLPIGTLPAGAIADAISAPVALLIMSAASLVMIAFVALRFPAIRSAPPEREAQAVSEIASR